jgi:hypothetical protein
VSGTPERAIVAVVIFLAAAATSYANHYLGIACCAMVLVAYLLVDRVTTCLLVIFNVPITQIFGLAADDLGWIQMIALGVLAVVALIELSNGSPRDRILQSRYGMILLAFLVLVVLHFSGFGFLETQGLVFLGILLLTFWLLRTHRHYHRAVCLGMVTAGVVGGALSFAFTYIPVPNLIMEPPTFDHTRMAGVFAGQNAAGRCIIPAFVYFLVLASEDLRWLLAATLCAILIAVTASKAAIIAMVAVTIFSVAFGARRMPIAGTVAIILATGYLVTLHPILVEQAGAAGPSPPKSAVHELDLGGSIVDELRIGRSSVMKELPSGEITYEDRKSDIWHTGQRDILWSAGINAIKQHPLWGIGYKQWSHFMQDTLGYPFRSPHNGFLEVSGGYGVAGMVLYVTLCAFVVLNVWRSKGTSDFLLKWTSLSIVIVPVVEAFDASMSLAVTLPAVWFWALAGVQESRLVTASSETSTVAAVHLGDAA